MFQNLHVKNLALITETEGGDEEDPRLSNVVPCRNTAVLKIDLNIQAVKMKDFSYYRPILVGAANENKLFKFSNNEFTGQLVRYHVKVQSTGQVATHRRRTTPG